MPLSSGLSIHDDTKHKGSAKRGAASGVAGLDASVEVLMAQLKTDVANGLAGLDADIKLNPLHIPFIESEYHNDFGYIDNFLSKVEVGAATITGDTANNEFDFNSPNLGDSGYLQTLNKHTLDGSPMVLIFNLKTVDNHGTARFYIGVHDSVNHAAPVHGYGWRIQLTTFQQRINPFTVNGGGVNVGTTIDGIDGYLMIIATSSQILFYRNGVLVDTLTGSIPPGALNIRVSMGYSGGACDGSIGTLAYKKYL